MPPNLTGFKLPNANLLSTSGEMTNPAALPGRVVYFFYPYTGKPGVADPEGWDHIKGAHGSTPQSLAFAKLWPEFQKHDVKIFGVSFQATSWQMEFKQRNNIPFDFLSDELRQWSTALQLQTFTAGGKPFLTRRTLFVENASVTHDLQVIADPSQNAADVLGLLVS